MCIRLLGAGLLILAVSCDGPTTAVRPETHKTLVWSDEFEGTGVDASLWSFEVGNNNGWGNGELEYYQAANAGVLPIPGTTSRALVITAKKEPAFGFAYTSSRLKTQGKASWTYGRIEARMKLPRGQGIWPAFWMLGDSISSVGWPKCGEIDIMEMVGGSGTRDQTTYGTAHWDENGHQYRGGSTFSASRLSDDWHLYAIDWTPSTIAWSFDGQVFQTQDTRGAAFTEFQKPAFLLLNLAVGGQWPGSPDASTIFPQEFWIDWIRVYQ